MIASRSSARWSPPGAPGRVVNTVLLVVLAADGLVVGVLSVFLNYLRFGSVAVPVGAVIAFVGNALLVWLAAMLTDAPTRWLPLLAWLLVILVAGFTGPGGDVVLMTDWRSIVLLLAGVAGPLLLHLGGRLG